MYLPNYKDGSIVNLMSSISLALNGKPKYNPLSILDEKELKKSKNIVLIVIDGFSYEYLVKKHKNTIFYKNLKGKMTSVFPSTTASAISTFVTGFPVQQNAISGWFTYLKELGTVSTILPFNPRYGGEPFSKFGIDPKLIFKTKPFSETINAKSYYLTSKGLSGTDYTDSFIGKSEIVPYRNLNDFMRALAYVLKFRNSRKKFIYGYWPELDTEAHLYGINSSKTYSHLRKLNSAFEKLLKKIENTNTTLIITGDHGLIDSTPKHTIFLENHPNLKKCLTLPLCGESRVVYCYVKPSKEKDFIKYVKEKLSKYCYLYKSEELIRNNYFGLFEPDKTLYDRIGDYVLIMKENYVMKDALLGEERTPLIGYHGGVSKEEMHVPLIVIKK